MNITCDNCGFEYDDVYRLTYCPHVEFEMHCKMTVKGVTRCYHSVDALHAAMIEADRP